MWINSPRGKQFYQFCCNSDGRRKLMMKGRRGLDYSYYKITIAYLEPAPLLKPTNSIKKKNCTNPSVTMQALPPFEQRKCERRAVI